MVTIISAIGPGGIIGSEKGLPWDIPEEYNKFLDHVRGNTVIMGRKSWEIFGADLPDTRFIVVSSSLSPPEGIIVAACVKEAVEIAKRFPEEAFIAGGAGVYKDGIPLADKMYLSFIRKEYPGNTFFPDFDSENWEVIRSEEYPEFVYKEFSKKLRNS